MGRSIYCSACKKEKEPGRDNESCCKVCKNERNRIKHAKQREEKGLRPYGEGRKFECSACEKKKENPNKSYCNACINGKARERWKETEALKFNKREITLVCECGKTKSSTQKIYCDDCVTARRKEKAKLAARKSRKVNGSKVNRGIYCSQCKGIKEHQNRGYCLSCERERYKDRDKPNCAICNTVKENPRDSYCNTCKREKGRLKSIIEERRPQNTAGMGRKTTCSTCGGPKENNYLSESRCKKCRYTARKDNRPFRTDEQKFKEAVRRFTVAKIKQGKLIRLPCEVCNTTEDIQAHHDDYYKPLDVRWLCRKHHREHHTNEDKRK